MPPILFATMRKPLLNEDPALCSIVLLFRSIRSFGPMVSIAPFLSIINPFARLFDHSLQLTPLPLHPHLHHAPSYQVAFSFWNGKSAQCCRLPLPPTFKSELLLLYFAPCIFSASAPSTCTIYVHPTFRAK